MLWIYLSLGVSLLSFLVAAYFYRWVKRLPTANPRLEEIGSLIRNGAFTFLKREYRILGLFSLAVVALLVLFFPQPAFRPCRLCRHLYRHHCEFEGSHCCP